MTDPTTPRTTLTRARVLGTAVALADREGIDRLTMRSLAAELGVEAMSLYHHVANKEDLLDGVADAIAGEMQVAVADLPAPAPSEWKAALRRRILTAREVMLRHPWAPGVFESRTGFGPQIVRYTDGFVGLLRLGGLSHDLVHHAMHALGSRAYGFTQELFDPAGSGDADASPEMLAQMATEAPHLVEMLAHIAHDPPGATLGRCDDQSEFEFGLDLLLDGLERRAAREPGA
ncbi:TetR/AcrR family transcriptional regulator C-terminal domain-containing protein [Microbacterium sp.]|uniref:TetR/AcrR family transcriptional regulator n=1 Tax=Microbacterium sp. TaxID=51671 RepID=UPI002810C122|nr:TetR/AcrR family transcriptional regulator C-terminal domain-containing protein [Microbacterium sp.]